MLIVPWSVLDWQECRVELWRRVVRSIDGNAGEIVIADRAAIEEIGEFAACAPGELRLALVDELREALGWLNIRCSDGGRSCLYWSIRSVLGRLDRPEAVLARACTVQYLDSNSVRHASIADDWGRDVLGFPDSLKALNTIGAESGASVDLGDVREIIGEAPVLTAVGSDGACQSVHDAPVITVLSGHCLVGLDPFEYDESSIVGRFSGGYELHEILQYQIVGQVVRSFRHKEVILMASDDIDYYSLKLRRRSSTLEEEVIQLGLRRVASRGQKLRSETVDGSFTDSCNGLTVEEVNGLTEEVAEFLMNSGGSVGGVSLREDRELRWAVATVAVSYLAPVVQGHIVVAVESALNIEIPSKVVIPFIRERAVPGGFIFIGLWPLPDLRMAHVSMHFGNDAKGRLNLSDSGVHWDGLVDQASRSWALPHRCWWTQFYMSYRGELPHGVCSQQLCNRHLELLKADLGVVRDDVQVDNDLIELVQ